MCQRCKFSAILLLFAVDVTYYYVQASVDYFYCRPGRYLEFFRHRFECDMPHEFALDQQPVALIVYPFIHQFVKL